MIVHVLSIKIETRRTKMVFQKIFNLLKIGKNEQTRRPCYALFADFSFPVTPFFISFSNAPLHFITQIVKA